MSAALKEASYQLTRVFVKESKDVCEKKKSSWQDRLIAVNDFMGQRWL